MRIECSKERDLSDLTQLLKILEQLRDQTQGGPWDCAQTFDSIFSYTLQEVYELKAAIDSGDQQEISTEVGDLLLQVLYYCQIAKEKGYFDFEQVALELKEKLYTRKPFLKSPQLRPKTIEEQLAQYEQCKKQTQKRTQFSNIEQGTKNLSAMNKAQALTQRAATLGFDWPNKEMVLEKIQEEVTELHESFGGSIEEMIEELGDLMFTCVNLARHLHVSADRVLEQANEKFIHRFSQMERLMVDEGKSMNECSLEQLDAYWRQCKSLD